MKEILVARVYMLESEHHLDAVLKILHDEVKIEHVIVFRGIEGFEKGGIVQASRLLSLSLSLPLVVEFFDGVDAVKQAINSIHKIIKHGRIITFNAVLNQ